MKLSRLFILVISAGVALSTISIPAQSADIPAVEADKGLVVFYRLRKAAGAAIRFNMQHNGSSIGNLTNGTVMYRHVEPGEHRFSVQSPSIDGKDAVSLNIDAGKIYYIKGEILWGWPAGRTKFTLVSESEAQADLKKLK